jgi:hypothetical protein
MELPEEGTRPWLGMKLVWIPLGVIVVVVILEAAWLLLGWSVSESVYSAEAAVDWFGITFYHYYLFVAGALFSLLLVYLKVGGSDLWRLVRVATRFFANSANS